MFRGLLVVVGMGLVAACIPLDVTAAQLEQDTLLAAPSSSRVNGPTRSGDGIIRLARSASQGTDKATSGKKRQAKNRPQDQAPVETTAVTPRGEPTPQSPQARTSPGIEPDGQERGLKSEPEQLSFDDKPIGFLEIEVSHSQHTFKLIAHHSGGTKEVLHECRVGLGGPGFPTPVGLYYVTHIYMDNPWWIPPKDRAWAAGDSPSKRVYGGTMAPLLKKRPVRVKKQAPAADLEDKIAGQVQLDDYGYRFHGTNQLRSIGHNQSHGCVRMFPADAAKVAPLIQERVGEEREGQSENGSFKVLKAMVRLNLVK
jgi:lipoprotein-anchoring transpeptidase ErfK/SrfK